MTAAAIALAVVVAGLGLLSVDPLIFPVRTAFVGTLVALGTIACIAAFSTRRRLAAAMLAAAAISAAWEGVRPAIDRVAVLGRTDAAALQVERRFVVGYGDPAAAREMALLGRVGGIFLTRRNVAGRTEAELSSWVAGLQADRRAAGLPPLIVAADQEGGPVSHLSPPLPAPPTLRLSQPCRLATAARPPSASARRKARPCAGSA